MSRSTVAIAIALLIFLTAGCASRGNVSGEVTFKGQPLPSGKVTYLCEGGDKPVLTSAIRDGAYEIRGAPLGPARITVETFETNTTPVPNMPKNVAISPKPDDVAPAPLGQSVRIPKRYSNPAESGLSYTIKGGDQKNDIELKP